MKDLVETTNMSLIQLSEKCPICNSDFSFEANEDLIKNAEDYPVVFTTVHCDRALICYVDKSAVIRMVETGYIGTDNNKKQDKKIDTLDISTLSINQRTILECNVDENTFQKQYFPNLIEKHIILLLMKHKNISLEDLRNELKIFEKSLNIFIDFNVLNGIIEKYIQNKFITKISL